MRNIRYFPNQSAFNSAYEGNEYVEPWVSYTTGVGLNYNKPPFSATVKNFLRSLPDGGHVVGIMPEFPCQINFNTWEPAYQEYYTQDGFLVNESGWGWCPINSLNDTWILNKIENINWSDCYTAARLADSYNIYPFKVLYDNYAHSGYYDETTNTNIHEDYVLINEDNGVLSIITDDQLLETVGDSSYQGGSGMTCVVRDTTLNTDYYATRYYEW